jgi:hypothetical protein
MLRTCHYSVPQIAITFLHVYRFLNRLACSARARNSSLRIFPLNIRYTKYSRYFLNSCKVAQWPTVIMTRFGRVVTLLSDPNWKRLQAIILYEMLELRKRPAFEFSKRSTRLVNQWPDSEANTKSLAQMHYVVSPLPYLSHQTPLGVSLAKPAQ